MIPKSFSATAMETSELCMARYKAEVFDYGRGVGSAAANEGTVAHAALELFVKACFIDKTMEPSEKLLADFYTMQYMAILNTADTDTMAYLEGQEMMTKWYARTVEYLSKVTVISAEQKLNFPLPFIIGAEEDSRPFNYILDRFDQLEETVFKVVDYKTNRWAVRPEDLKKRIQVRAYGLATQIRYPQATQIWVELDMLRHDGPVGVVITRDDNIEAWDFFKRRAQAIVDQDPNKVLETLNNSCRFCVRKQACNALRQNILVGGVMSLGTAQEIVDIRAQLEYQKSAVESAIKEVDAVLMAEAKETDVFEWQSDENVMSIGSSGVRSADAERVAMVIGEELFHKYGATSITMGSIDKLLKGNEIDPDKKVLLRSLIYKKMRDPKVSVKPRSPFDE